jgi:Uma2 family endonuclease
MGIFARDAVKSKRGGTMRTLTLLSDEEFLALPEYPGKQELLNGELIELPPAKKYHSEMAKVLYKLLLTVLHDSRVWIEAGYQLRTGRWAVPDISVTFPDQAVAGWYQGAPMLAIEIASRGNIGSDLEIKTQLYFEHGAEEVWILYPDTRTMLVSRHTCVERIAEGQTYYCALLDLDVDSSFWVPAE